MYTGGNLKGGAELLKSESRDTLYGQVESHIIAYMEEARETKLLPESELSEKFKVSRTTITKALENLKAKGLIRKRKGHGNFILKSVLQEPMCLNSGADYAALIRHAGFLPTLDRNILNYNYPDREIRQILGLTTEELVLSIEYIFLADGKRAIHTVQHLPKKLIKETPRDDRAEGADIDSWDFFNTYTNQIFSHVIFQFVPSVNSGMVHFFDLRDGTCMQGLKQRSFNIYDQVIAYSLTHLNPEIMNLSLMAEV
jgi:DNA-binding GntR family transcriptional regulator